MRKELALMLAGVASFDLGTFAVTAQAATDYFLKIDNLAPQNEYLKIQLQDLTVTSIRKASESCAMQKGTLVEYKASHYCSIPKAKVTTTTHLPATQALPKKGISEIPITK
jgi:hypothetical protein